MSLKTKTFTTYLAYYITYTVNFVVRLQALEVAFLQISFVFVLLYIQENNITFTKYTFPARSLVKRSLRVRTRGQRTCIYQIDKQKFTIKQLNEYFYQRIVILQLFLTVYIIINVTYFFWGKTHIICKHNFVYII